MGEVVRFVPKAELERIRLIRQARAMYENVFPSAEPVNEPRRRTSMGRAAGTNTVPTGNGISDQIKARALEDGIS